MREADVPAPRARRDEEREVPSVARSEPVVSVEDDILETLKASGKKLKEST